MKIYRFSIILVFITLVALLYVHQQVQLVKIGYKIEANERDVTSLLDQNKTLMYNITKLKSPVYLEKKFLASTKEFNIPQQWQVVELTTPRAEKEPIKIAQVKKGPIVLALFRIFGRPQEVLANPLETQISTDKKHR